MVESVTKVVVNKERPAPSTEGILEELRERRNGQVAEDCRRRSGRECKALLPKRPFEFFCLSFVPTLLLVGLLTGCVKRALGLTWGVSFAVGLSLGFLVLVAIGLWLISRVPSPVDGEPAIGPRSSVEPVQLSPECVEELALSEEHTRRYEVWCGGSKGKSSKGDRSPAIGSRTGIWDFLRNLSTKTKVHVERLYFRGRLAILGGLLTIAVALVLSDGEMAGVLMNFAMGLCLSVPVMALLLPNRPTTEEIAGNGKAAIFEDEAPALSTEGMPERIQERVRQLRERAQTLQRAEEERGSGMEGVEQRDQLRRIFGELLPPVIAGFVKLNTTTAGGAKLKGEAEFVEVLGEIEERLTVLEKQQEEREWQLFVERKETLGEYLKVTAGDGEVVCGRMRF